MIVGYSDRQMKFAALLRFADFIESPGTWRLVFDKEVRVSSKEIYFISIEFLRDGRCDISKYEFGSSGWISLPADKLSAEEAIKELKKHIGKDIVFFLDLLS